MLTDLTVLFMKLTSGSWISPHRFKFHLICCVLLILNQLEHVIQLNNIYKSSFYLTEDSVSPLQRLVGECS